MILEDMRTKMSDLMFSTPGIADLQHRNRGEEQGEDEGS